MKPYWMTCKYDETGEMQAVVFAEGPLDAIQMYADTTRQATKDYIHLPGEPELMYIKCEQCNSKQVYPVDPRDPVYKTSVGMQDKKREGEA